MTDRLSSVILGAHALCHLALLLISELDEKDASSGLSPDGCSLESIITTLFKARVSAAWKSCSVLANRREYARVPITYNPGPMKILMLHGYTQSGPLFHAKTKVLEKFLKKLYPDLTLSYPTGPLRLRPEDIPGYESSGKIPDDLEAYGWWRRSNTADPPEYAGIDVCFNEIAKLIATEGPFDGVMGFSQGAGLAAMVTSLLERPLRQDAFKRARESSSLAIPYPASFENLQQPPLKFLVSYCGFRAPGERYNGFYEDPIIQTSSCHVNGSLDTLVEESKWRTLMDACGGEGMTRLVIHPGGHFVPSGKQYLETVADFIRTCMSPQSAKKSEEKEVRAEDMDMPF